MKAKNQAQGQAGENAAVKYLMAKGYKVLARNWRFRKYEVDIIMEQGQEVVFVEVKTRKTDTFGEPELFVSPRKQKFLITAAHSYLVERDIEKEARFDVVAVIKRDTQTVIRHIEGAFTPRVR